MKNKNLVTFLVFLPFLAMICCVFPWHVVGIPQPGGFTPETDSSFFFRPIWSEKDLYKGPYVDEPQLLVLGVELAIAIGMTLMIRTVIYRPKPEPIEAQSVEQQADAPADS